MINPHRFAETFFNEDGTARVDGDGKPILDNAKKLMAFTQSVPINQLPNVTKVFEIDGFGPAGLLFSGIAGIGNKSTKHLVEEFTAEVKEKVASNKLIDVANLLSIFLNAQFDSELDLVPAEYRPLMEVILSGYSADSRLPEIYKIIAGPQSSISDELKDDQYRIVFGGQYDVIQRVVVGIDLEGYSNLCQRFEAIVSKYRDAIIEKCRKDGYAVEIPEIEKDEGSRLFGQDFGGVKGIFSDNKNLSEQAAINFVDFLITTMINAQEFSDTLPTVGGQVHIALINKQDGFRWISREEYKFRDHAVKIYE